MKHTVVDNFLPSEYFESLFNLIDDHNFPWFYGNYVADADDNKDSYFVHSFYQDNAVNSNLFTNLKPLIEHLNAKAVIRVRALTYTRQSVLLEHGKHTDFPFSHNVCVLYLNTNDGFTRLDDGTRIESVRNRALFFDGSLDHNSTNCTSAQRRMVLTINYF